LLWPGETIATHAQRLVAYLRYADKYFGPSRAA